MGTGSVSNEFKCRLGAAEDRRPGLFERISEFPDRPQRTLST